MVPPIFDHFTFDSFLREHPEEDAQLWQISQACLGAGCLVVVVALFVVGVLKLPF